jgi:hypothetical protein
MTILAAIAGSLHRGSVNRLLPRGRPALTRQAAPDPCRLADRAAVPVQIRGLQPRLPPHFVLPAVG